MSHDHEGRRGSDAAERTAERSHAPGKRTLTQSLPGSGGATARASGVGTDREGSRGAEVEGRDLQPDAGADEAGTLDGRFLLGHELDAAYRDADVVTQARLAVRAAGAAAEAGVKLAAATKDEARKPEIFRSVAAEIRAHLDLVDALGVDGARYAAEAAAAAKAIHKFLGAGADYLGESIESLVARAHVLSVWGAWQGGAIEKSKGFGGAARKDAVILALRGARDAADAALAELDHGEPPPTVLPRAAAAATLQMSYVRTLFRSDEHPVDTYRHDVEIATSALGRLVAWAGHRRLPTSTDEQRASRERASVADLIETVGAVRQIVGLGEVAWIGDLVDGSSVAADPTPPHKDPARRALEGWNRAALKVVDTVAAWSADNWIEFLGMTSSNPRLSWDMQLFSQTASNLVGNLLTEVNEKLIKRGAAGAAGAIFGSVAGPAGTATGFVIGMIIETVASVLYDYFLGDHGTEDRAAATGSRRTAAMVRARLALLEQGAGAGRQTQLDAFDAAQAALDQANSQAKVDAIAADAGAEQQVANGPANRGDLSLHRAMLADWVREHAGNASDGNKETSETQWEAASQEAFGARKLFFRPEVFAYQTRAEWAQTGLNDDEIRKHVDHLLAITESRRKRVNATEVKEIFNGRELGFRNGVSDIEKLTSYLKRKGTPLTKAGVHALEDDYRVIAATCTLDLATDYGTCYVNKWRYELEFVDGTVGFGLPGLPTKRSASFEVSPD